MITKVQQGTNVLNITIPRSIVRRAKLKVGDELVWELLGDGIRLVKFIE